MKSCLGSLQNIRDPDMKRFIVASLLHFRTPVSPLKSPRQRVLASLRTIAG